MPLFLHIKRIVFLQPQISICWSYLTRIEDKNSLLLLYRHLELSTESQDHLPSNISPPNTWDACASAELHQATLLPITQPGFLGAVCHLPLALLWMETPFATFSSPYTGHKTHSPFLNVGYLDWFFVLIGIPEWEIVQCLEDFNFCAELHIFSLRTAGHAGPCFIRGYLTQTHCANSCSLSVG